MNHLCIVFACGWVLCVQAGIRGQLVGGCSLIPPCGFWGLKSGCQTWGQAPLHAEPAHWLPLSLLRTYIVYLLMYYYYYHYYYWHIGNWTRASHTIGKCSTSELRPHQPKEGAFLFDISPWNNFCSFGAIPCHWEWMESDPVPCANQCMASW